MSSCTSIAYEGAASKRHPLFRKLQKKIGRLTGDAISQFRMIEKDDRVMVCLSGGKDSWTLLDILLYLQRKSPVPFSVFAINIDPAFPGYRSDIIERYCHDERIEFHRVETIIDNLLKDKLREGTLVCSLCARLRRGNIYGAAEKYGATKIALGHHREDFNETLLMNIFFHGMVKSMAPRLVSDDGKHTVIRPLVYVPETDTRAYAFSRFPIVCCNCPMCGQESELERAKMKQMIRKMSLSNPALPSNLLRAQSRIISRHLLVGNQDTSAEEVFF